MRTTLVAHGPSVWPGPPGSSTSSSFLCPVCTEARTFHVGCPRSTCLECTFEVLRIPKELYPEYPDPFNDTQGLCTDCFRLIHERLVL